MSKQLTPQERQQLSKMAKHLRAVTEHFGVNSEQYRQAKADYALLCKKLGV